MEERPGLIMKKGAQPSFGNGVFNQEGAAGLREFELLNVGAAWYAYNRSYKIESRL